MIIEALSQLFSGNLSWFFDIVLNNLHWVFALFAFNLIASQEAGVNYNYIRNFVFLVGSLWAFVSIAGIIGMSLFSAGLFLVVQLLLITFWPKSLSKKYPSLQVYIIWFLYSALSLLLTFGIIGLLLPYI